MDAGNDLRQTLGSGDALAAGAIARITELRLTTGSPEPLSRYAYILRSLKHPEEVKTLRRVYGEGLTLVAAYEPRPARVRNLSNRLAQSRHSSRPSEFGDSAEKLMIRDESERGNIFGQNVRDTFPLADLFVDVSDPSVMNQSISRYIDLFFGYPFYTPTREEYAMFLAEAAALRSAALARQVGAVIATEGGDIIAVGTNEVPKAGGGQYWSGDHPDNRDFQLGYETSDRMKDMLLADILRRLQEAGWLASARRRTDIRVMVKELTVGNTAPMQDSQLMDLIEFARPMHAEMAGLLDAARRGVSTEGKILSTTTFPCHDCARHIVAAGMKKVIYIHPYPKSHAVQLYPDSLRIEGGLGDSQVDCEPFIGIAPRRYMNMFEKVKRKEEDGVVVQWDKANAMPRFTPPHPAYLGNEEDVIVALRKRMTDIGVEAATPTRRQ
jgi:cytidine deaminase